MNTDQTRMNTDDFYDYYWARYVLALELQRHKFVIPPNTHVFHIRMDLDRANVEVRQSYVSAMEERHPNLRDEFDKYFVI